MTWASQQERHHQWGIKQTGSHSSAGAQGTQTCPGSLWGSCKSMGFVNTYVMAGHGQHPAVPMQLQQGWQHQHTQHCMNF